MEEIHSNHITQNIDRLVELTDCNVSVLAHLQSKEILGLTDIAELNAIPNQLEKSYTLYNILLDRKDSYEHLLAALKSSLQTGALEVLTNRTVPSPIERAGAKRSLLTFTEWKEKKSRLYSIKFDVKPPVDLFTGRKQQLSDLHEKIVRNPERFTVISQLTSVSGLGGIGKTELCRMYIQQHGEYFDGNVIWINGESQETLIESFRRLAKDKLKISTKDANGDEKHVQSIVEDVYNYFKDSKCLFVFDNAEKGEHFATFFPTVTGFKTQYILITSRDREWGKAEECIVDLHELELSEAIEMVKTGLEIKDDSQNEQILLLVNSLQRFPLALHQAIAFIKYENEVGDYSISDYVTEYEANPEELLSTELSTELFNNYTKTTFQTWNMTIKRIGKDKSVGQLATEILNFVAYFQSERIFRELFLELAGGQTRKLQGAVRLLVKYSMINGEEKQSILSIHRLVQQVTRIKLELENGEVEILQKVLNLLGKEITEKTVTHAISAWNHASKYNTIVREFKTVPSGIVNCLQEKVRLQEALHFGKVAETHLQTCVGMDSEEVMEIRGLMGQLWCDFGKYGESLEVCYELINQRGKLQQENLPATLQTQHDIAFTLCLQGKYKEALDIYSDVYERRKRVLGDSHEQTLDSMANIGVCAYSLGNYEAALKAYKTVQELETGKKSGVNPGKLLSTTLNIALVHGDMGNIGLAVETLRELHQKMSTFPERSAKLEMDVTYNLALHLNRNKEHDEALQMFTQLYEQQKTLLGEEHPDTLLTLDSYGCTLEDLGKCDEALAAFQKAYEMFKKCYGENSPKTLFVKRNIAADKKKRENYSEAVVMFEEIYTKLKRELEEGNVELLNTGYELADILWKMGNLQEALGRFKELQTKYESEFGEDHKGSKDCLRNIQEIELLMVAASSNKNEIS